jgi:hypothetical protein
MISPASGIHRPSYNGAPARQTYNFEPIVLVASDASAFCGLHPNSYQRANVYRRNCLHRSTRAFHKLRSHQHRVFRRRMTMFR